MHIPSGVSKPSFLPLHSLTLRLKLRSRSLRAQKAATLTLSLPSAFRHRPPAPPHIPTPQAEARSLPAEKRPQAPARQAVRSLATRAERPQPCARPHSASSVAVSTPLTLPHAGPEAAGRKQSGRESQPQAPDTPCPLSALRASCVHRDLKNIIASSPEGYTTHILTDKAI